MKKIYSELRFLDLLVVSYKFTTLIKIKPRCRESNCSLGIINSDDHRKFEFFYRYYAIIFN